jgi:integrase
MDQRTATGRETVASFAARWTVDYPRPRASTNVHNGESVRSFASAHARRRMDSITVEEARTWALRHPAQLLALRAMFNDARRSGMIVSNPFRELSVERSRGRRDLPSEWLTAKDVDRLAQCAREVHAANGYGDTLAGLLVFAAYTGLRSGELYALRHDDLGVGTLEVKRAADSHTRSLTMPKNGRARTVVYPTRRGRPLSECRGCLASTWSSRRRAACSCGPRRFCGSGTRPGQCSDVRRWRCMSCATSARPTCLNSAWRQPTSLFSSGTRMAELW